MRGDVVCVQKNREARRKDAEVVTDAEQRYEYVLFAELLKDSGCLLLGQRAHRTCCWIENAYVAVCTAPLSGFVSPPVRCAREWRALWITTSMRPTSGSSPSAKAK